MKKKNKAIASITAMPVQAGDKQAGLRRHGFTLIELLVVISIIGILTSIAVVSLNDARYKARDAKRKADLAQLRVALAMYYDDNLEYPKCGDLDKDRSDFGATADCYNNSLEDALISSTKPYMASLPKDPKDVGIYVYKYVSDGIEFAVVYETENSRDNSPILVRGW